jgi:hypothetical protein
MRNGRPVLPGTKPKPPAMPFRMGTKVLMKCMPSGMPGIVQGVHRHRVLVRWGDLNFVGKHKPDSLVLAADAKESEHEH